MANQKKSGKESKLKAIYKANTVKMGAVTVGRKGGVFALGNLVLGDFTMRTLKSKHMFANGLSSLLMK